VGSFVGVILGFLWLGWLVVLYLFKSQVGGKLFREGAVYNPYKKVTICILTKLIDGESVPKCNN